MIDFKTLKNVVRTTKEQRVATDGFNDLRVSSRDLLEEIALGAPHYRQVTLSLSISKRFTVPEDSQDAVERLKNVLVKDFFYELYGDILSRLGRYAYEMRYMTKEEATKALEEIISYLKESQNET